MGNSIPVAGREHATKVGVGNRPPASINQMVAKESVRANRKNPSRNNRVSNP